MARETRLPLWREHLGRTTESRVDDLLEPDRAFRAFRECAHELDCWYADRARGDGPPSRVRIHRPERVPTWHRWWAHAVSRVVNDPDGRPRRLRATDGC